MSEISSNETGANGDGQGDQSDINANVSAGRGTLCAKCEHLNPLGLEKCETCQAHLFVFCAQCGTKNGRVLTRCRKCRRRLKLGLSKRIRSGDRDDERKSLNLVYLAVGVLLLVGGSVWMIKYLGVRLW